MLSKFHFVDRNNTVYFKTFYGTIYDQITSIFLRFKFKLKKMPAK